MRFEKRLTKLGLVDGDLGQSRFRLEAARNARPFELWTDERHELKHEVFDVLALELGSGTTRNAEVLLGDARKAIDLGPYGEHELRGLFLARAQHLVFQKLNVEPNQTTGGFGSRG